MTNDDDDQRQFDRDHAEKILARAATLTLARREDSSSLAELVDAAEAAGIDGALVRRAAAELEVDLVEPPMRFGMKTRVVRRRWLSRRLGRAELERLGARLDALFGAHGHREVHGEAASWTARHIHVTVEPDKAGSMIQISERFVNTTANRGGLAAMLGGGVSLLLTLAAQASLGPVAWLAVAPLAIALSWLALTVMRRNHELKLERVAAEFERALESLDRATLTETPALDEGSQ